MTTPTGWSIYESPIGPLKLVAGPRGLANVHFPDRAPRLPEEERREMPTLGAQLDEYFTGARRAFELDLDLRGDPLQLAVWERLLEIPYGTTATYGEVAGAIDEALYDPALEPYRRARVVGAAIGRNPVAIVVPCHRVIGADGSLTGYYGGLERKRTLLELEGLAMMGEAVKTSPPSSQIALL